MLPRGATSACEISAAVGVLIPVANFKIASASATVGAVLPVAGITIPSGVVVVVTPIVVRAVHVALVPPLLPLQVQLHGPLPLTVAGVPLLHRYVEGATVKIAPLEGPQTPLMVETCVAGVTRLEAAEAELVPTELVAVTVKVYAVPLVRPVMVIGLAVPIAVMLPGDEVTVKPVMAASPLEAGAVKLTVAWALPAVAVPMVGVPRKVCAGGVVKLHTVLDARRSPVALLTPLTVAM